MKGPYTKRSFGIRIVWKTSVGFTRDALYYGCPDRRLTSLHHPATPTERSGPCPARRSAAHMSEDPTVAASQPPSMTAALQASWHRAVAARAARAVEAPRMNTTPRSTDERPDAVPTGPYRGG